MGRKGYLHEDDLTKSTTDTTIQTDDWGISWWTNVPNNEEADSRYNRAVEMAKLLKVGLCQIPLWVPLMLSV